MRVRQAFLIAALAYSATVVGQVRFGGFIDPIQAEFVRGSDGERRMRLLRDVVYVAVDGKRWTAPKDFLTDGASIPRVFWSFVGGPFDGQYREAAVVHDYYCQTKTEAWQDVHRIFYYACRAAGVDELKAKILYAAVRYGGPKWNRGRRSSCFAECHAQRTPEGLSKDAQGRDSFQASISQGDAESLAAWVMTRSPSLEEIDAYVDKVYPGNRLGHDPR